METNTWPLAKAKAQFTDVVNAAVAGSPQVITRHGEPVVLVISTRQYIGNLPGRESLVEFFEQSPLVGVDLSLSRTRGTGRDNDR